MSNMQKRDETARLNTPLAVYGTDTLFCASNDAWCMVQARSVVSVVSESIRRSHICCSCDSLLPCAVLDRLVRWEGIACPLLRLRVCPSPLPPRPLPHSLPLDVVDHRDRLNQPTLQSVRRSVSQQTIHRRTPLEKGIAWGQTATSSADPSLSACLPA